MNFDIILQGFIIITGLAGQVLVGRRNHNGFLFWIAGNAALIYNFVGAGQLGLAALYGVYTGISIYSIVSWKKQAQPDAA